jgi:hypothetical protein
MTAIRQGADCSHAATLEERIASTDQRMDGLVCELYDLSDAEAAAVCRGEWDSC